MSYNDIKIVYPIFCFDVSKQDFNIYRSGSPDDIEIKLLLDQVPGIPHLLHKKTIMKVHDSKSYILIYKLMSIWKFFLI